jgi:undecaprenyl-diphosphatase
MLWPSWDRTVFLSVNGFHSDLLTQLMRFLTNVDNWIPFLVALVAALLWLGRTAPRREADGGRLRRALCRRNPRIVILCLILAAAASDQTCYHIKKWVERPRPCFDESFSHLVEYRGDVHGYRSFPSSHAANSAALATTLSLAYPPLIPYASLGAFLVGFSRVYLGVHYPLDVLTGWGTGVAAAILVWLVFRRWLDRPGVVGFTNRFRYRQPALSRVPPSPWKEVELRSLDGFQMKGYLRSGDRGLAVVVHGLHGDAISMTQPGDILAGLGFSVLLVPLRGHDSHPVPVTSGGPQEALDLAGALLQAGSEMGFRRSETVIYGSSMGGSTALKVAGLLDDEVAGVIAHGAYSDFFRSARFRMGGFRTALLKLILPPGVRLGLKEFRPADYAGRCRQTRIVYITGELDRISPPEISIELSGMTGGGVIAMEGAKHPVWDRPGWNREQMGAAMNEAVRFIRGEVSGDLRIDGSGNIHDHPGSSGVSTGRGK